MRLVLASASPRRADLLRAAGYSFETLAVDLDEEIDWCLVLILRHGVERVELVFGMRGVTDAGTSISRRERRVGRAFITLHDV